MTSLLARAWHRINEPRTISVLYFVSYLVLTAGGVTALVIPPTSLEGEIGATAMTMLASLLVFGGSIGSVSALPGIYWLERFAVGAIASSATIYLLIIVTLHFTSTGNRLLQAAFVCSVLLHQGVRWMRIRERPYRPEAATAAEV
ncbi:hypothetical protein D9V41_14715 [Aeromicrobium phragmitis]|uniref:Uncharacterized protein n=1 Tax=Aeromicrobium phragmitis TaxID=2478914 RepID=A0A3L8PJA0_9ACTN|nr:hypothetical protein [Aeromicrobium phragmitis]RLV54839.1 hypothetical protein D9V41_14715 [Aeromicrobium phragmitis]